MLSLTSSSLLKAQFLQSTGGCLQHARALLSLLTVEGASSSNGAIWSSSPSAGRFISTTRGIYMGRVFIRENLVKAATPSTLYTRDNYQFLAENRWSLAACEQVLGKHEQTTGKRTWKQARETKPFDRVNRALNERINATTSLHELRVVIEEQAHRMTQINMAVVIQKVPQLLFTRKAQPDFDAAAVLLDHVAGLLQPTLQHLSGANICSCVASFSKCRYSPSGEMLESLSQQLLENDAKKLKSCSLASIGQLLIGITKLVHSQAQWPLYQAVLEEMTHRLTALLEQQQQQDNAGKQQRSDAGDQSTDVLPETDHSSEQQQQQQQQEEALPTVDAELVRTTNSIALIAWCLDNNRVNSPEFTTVLHKWMAHPLSLRALLPTGAIQLWNVVRGQYVMHWRMTTAAAAAAAAGSSSSNAAESAAEGESSSAAAATEGDQAAAGTGSSDRHSHTDNLQKQQIRLRECFGSGTLDNLAAATAQLIPRMTEKELGQILASVSAVRYNNADFVAAAAAGFENMCKNMQPSTQTLISAAWLAGVLHTPRPALLQPVFIAAATAPGSFDGVCASRLLRLTGMLSAAELQQQQVLLRQELHRRSDARGPPPTAAAAVLQPGQNYDWVASIADDFTQRMATLKPGEIAQFIAAFSQVPGVVLHEGLFAAAAAHIETHAHTFTRFRDMELVASAFEAMNYTEGLAALKALQQQTENLAAKQF